MSLPTCLPTYRPTNNHSYHTYLLLLSTCLILPNDLLIITVVYSYVGSNITYMPYYKRYVCKARSADR